MAHVSEKKKKVVQDLTKLINENSIIGAVNMKNLPAKQLQEIRKQIRENATLKMAKRTLIKLAFKNSSKKDIDKLTPYLEGMPALIFTNKNPFKLAMDLDKNKSTAPAKPGQTAPNDIYVKPGATAFTPGPIIGQLGKVGVKTSVENGKIVIKDESLVCEKGETITPELANILLRLKIEPMEIGLELTAVYEDGFIFEKDILTINKDKYFNDFRKASINSFSLALSVSYATKETINNLLLNAYTEAKSLALSQDIITKDNIKDLLNKAQLQLISLSAGLPEDSVPTEIKNIKKTEKKEPEKQEKEKTKPEEKQEKKTEEEAAQGLGSLFG